MGFQIPHEARRTIGLRVLSFRLFKTRVINEGEDNILELDRLSLDGKIFKPQELRGNSIVVELQTPLTPQGQTTEKPQIKTLGGYKGIGTFIFLPVGEYSEIESGRSVEGHFSANVDIDRRDFSDVLNLMVSLDGNRDIDRVIELSVGLLNNWDLKACLPALSLNLIVTSEEVQTDFMDVAGNPSPIVPPLIIPLPEFDLN